MSLVFWILELCQVRVDLKKVLYRVPNEDPRDPHPQGVFSNFPSTFLRERNLGFLNSPNPWRSQNIKWGIPLPQMLLPEDPQAKKSLVSLSICQIAACFYLKMVRNYHNFIKSNLNFSKRLGDFSEFWGTLRKKVIPHSPGNEKSKFPNSPNLDGIEKVIPHFPHFSRKKL